MKTTWIPQPNDLATWQGKQCRIISIDLGGKCKIKIGKITIKEIDISELTPKNN